MKRLVILVLILVLAALAFPIVNLIVGSPETALASFESDDPQLTAVAHIFAEKCVNCHTAEYKLPWYANFPVAKGLIEHDIQMGLRTVDMMAHFPPADGEPVDEVFLAKVEWTTQQDTMPPMRYIALHWDDMLSAQEKETLLDWVADVRAEHYQVDGVAQARANEPVQPLPAIETLDIDAQKAALGDKLFHDKRLSADDTLSCVSCHALDKGGTDQAPVSTGTDDQKGPINSPTVYNAGFQFAQFWDGRSVDLQDQAGGPVTNPIEMGTEWPPILAKLEEDPEFMAEFSALYGELTNENVQDAIAEFERTLITPDSDFDRYMKGDDNAMSEAALRGFAHFKEFGCATCHVGKVLGGQSYELMGYRKDYFGKLDRALIPEDNGRYNVTEDERDRHKFKVPTLLNIEVTYPYFHDASAETLEEAVQVMAEHQSDVILSEAETADLVAFMKALTGKYQGEKLE
ncbi:MAG: cytochrome c peroxidase [Candidatus Hydrogenedentota bacterium]